MTEVKDPLSKRLFDVIASLCGLILLAPVLVVVGILVRVKLGSPVLFRQARPGRLGQPFQILKFRTMTDTKDSEGNLLPDEDRLTSFGRFLRSSSLDELPELINVLKGEMSLVGPRPLIMAYLSRYTPEQAKRNLVRPGITGLAQVNGRNAISWEERFSLDVHYVERWTFWLDIKILGLTVVKVLKRDGITATNHASMTEFMGQEKPNGNLE